MRNGVEGKTMNNPVNSLPKDARDFLSYLSTIKGRSNNTILSYAYDLQKFFKFLKCFRDEVPYDSETDISNLSIDWIRTITLSDLYEFMTYANLTENASARTRARYVATLRSFFKYLCNKAKLIETNPALELDSPKLRKSLPRYLSLDDSKQLLSTAASNEHRDPSLAARDYCILTFFLNCGMRLSELVGIDVNHIHTDRLTVLGKGNKERTVYLNQACLNALEAYLPERAKGKMQDKRALFLSKEGKRLTNRMVQLIVKRNLELAGLDTTLYSTHKLRHTAATLMYKHGHVDVRALQEILGHEHLNTTEIYTHIDDEGLRDAAGKNPLASL